MVKPLRGTDDADSVPPPTLSLAAKQIIGVVVFVLGILAGAAIAALVIPPS